MQKRTVHSESSHLGFRFSFEKLRYFYHPDHASALLSTGLGSTSWVTDSAKNGVQYCEYLLYGEPFLDQRSTTWNSRYTFAGKERDNETGYSYFGARYYNSDVSIWLSVDPLSDKYPHQSNYVYCSNNPIRFIDPNGEDEYEIDRKGNITWKCESEKHQLFAIDKNGKQVGVPLTVKDDATLKQLSKSQGKTILINFEGNLEQQGNRRFAEVDKDGVEDMLKIFKFAADNTDVEWIIECKKDKGISKYSIATSGFDCQVQSVYGESAITSIHSHPREPDDFQQELNSLYGDRSWTSSTSKTNKYVYMPKSTRLFSVNKNSYIRHINNDYRRFINLGR